ncbi:anti-sigma factor [Bacteroidia bacterium]|nr:anti-sigma factor [Bacteroidia bacterium]
MYTMDNREILYKFFEGKCSEEEIQEIRTWVEASPENKKTFFQEAKLFDTVDLLTSEELVPEQQEPGFYRNPFYKELLKIAATVAIVLSIAGGWYYYTEKNARIAMNIIHAPAGKNANIILPDGTAVWLNARTTVQYPSSFEKNKRVIILDGEAYFEVAHDKKKPFIVRTNKYDVEVTGTKFNVEAYSFEDETITSLLDGQVKLISVTDPNQSITMEPHHLAFLQEDKFITKKITDYNRYRWKDGLICFDNISFPEIMKEFEKYYEIQVIIENKKVNDYLCTGKFRQSDGVDYALKVLQRDVRFIFERVENTNIIYIK